MGSVAGKNTVDAAVRGSSGGGSGGYDRRRAHHAGSWYEQERDTLHETLAGYLRNASVCTDDGVVVRAVIAPHAGYAYSGPTAAYSYQAVLQEVSSETSSITKILVLHPSHHVYLPGRCAVSNAVELETPIGNLKVDDHLRREILNLGNTFTVMTATQDEHEHSGEMQYPYLAHLLKQAGKIDSITVTPVMCGSLKIADEIACGALLSAIIARPEVLTVVSTDFCHWGRRFQYQPVDDRSTSTLPIHEFIEQLDRRGMDAIAAQQPGAFAEYLKETSNTVCGRHAIAVWLRAVAAAANNDENNKLSVEFVKYAQSSQSKSMSDSSVSYAAAVATIATPSSSELSP